MLLGGKKIGLMETAKTNQKDLLIIKELLETGKVVPVIDRTYPLAETADSDPLSGNRSRPRAKLSSRGTS